MENSDGRNEDLVTESEAIEQLRALISDDATFNQVCESIEQGGPDASRKVVELLGLLAKNEMNPDAISRWMTNPLDVAKGKTPLEAIRSNEVDKLTRAVRRYLEGVNW